MAEIISPIENGQIIKNNVNKTESTSSNNNLGKDAFLQLLVCQMQNQDPLEPQDNSEYIAQLATFTQLETLQNIEGAIGNSQAMNLSGKFVDVTTVLSNGKTAVVSGYVDYVTINDNKAYVVIEGKSYLADKITTVYDDAFLEKIINEDINGDSESEKEENEAATGDNDNTDN